MKKDEAISATIQALRDHCKVSQKAYSTEKTYVGWARRYIAFLYDMKSSLVDLTSEKKVEVWLTRLATDGCAASTQNQAFNAVVCLYREVWKKPLSGINSLRAKRRHVERHAPCISDISRAFAHVQDTSAYPIKLILHLLYGAGLRVGEGIALRIKDIDFGNNTLFIHDSKHGKDRYVAIPQPLFEPLKRQVEVATMKAQIDITQRLPVQMPNALDRKYKNAAYSVPWHYLFPKVKPCECPRRKILVRFHILDSTLQRYLKNAVRLAGLNVPFTPHNLRHAYATHLVDRGANIKAIQEAMGHTSVMTTFGYVHHDALSVGSPLEKPAEVIPFPTLHNAASQ